MLLLLVIKNLHGGVLIIRSSCLSHPFEIRIFHKAHIASNVSREKARAVRISVDAWKFCVSTPALSMYETGLRWIFPSDVNLFLGFYFLRRDTRGTCTQKIVMMVFAT